MTETDFAAATGVSRETLGRISAYERLIAQWNPAINLVSRSSLADFWGRHALDSAQLLRLAPPGARGWLDLGSGGGFPGLVVAILAAEQRPDLRVTLVESDQRKAAFLRTVARETGTAVTVIAERAESVPPAGADVVSARALAPLDRLLPLAERHLTTSGMAIFPKGAAWRAEVNTALANWRFNLQNHASLTDPKGAVLVLEGISRA
jgi:16S rRNA (guanine527-N7)-methyltransferase